MKIFFILRFAFSDGFMFTFGWGLEFAKNLWVKILFSDSLLDIPRTKKYKRPRSLPIRMFSGQSERNILSMVGNETAGQMFISILSMLKIIHSSIKIAVGKYS